MNSRAVYSRRYEKPMLPVSKSAKPAVWVRTCRMVTADHAGGVPSTYFDSGSSSPTFPSSTNSRIASAANCLLIDPIS